MIESNEDRADYGERGIKAADPDWGSNETVISVKDAISTICHAIMRMGLDPEQMLDAGLESFRQDCDPNEIAGYEPVVHDTNEYPDPEHEMPRSKALSGIHPYSDTESKLKWITASVEDAEKGIVSVGELGTANVLLTRLERQRGTSHVTDEQLVEVAALKTRIYEAVFKPATA